MVLVLILAVVYSASRREARTLDAADKITAAEMMRAVSLFNEMNESHKSETKGASNEEVDAGELVNLCRIPKPTTRM